MTTTDEVKSVLGELVEKVEGYKADIKAERELREELERKVNGQRFAAARDPDEAPTAYIYDRESKRRVPVLSHKQRLSDLPEYRSKEPLPSMGRVLRGLVLGNRADDGRELEAERKALGIVSDASGGILAPDLLSARWVDLLRAKSVLSAAGAVTIPVESKTLTMAVLSADPAVSWRAENSALTASDPTFSSLVLSPKTVATVVKVSLELAQDSSNIEQVLETSLVNSMATAIDRAGLVGETTNAALAPLGLFNTPNRGTVTGVGAPTNYDHLLDALYTLEAANVPQESIAAVVGHPAYWRKLRKLKTGLTSDQTTLIPPPDVARLPRLSTTAAPLTGNTAKAIIGNWSDCLIGLRQGITVRVLSESFLGSNLQVAVLCYARVDIAAARPASFVTCEGITVS